MIDCMLNGYCEDYSVATDADDLQFEFEVALSELGIKPTQKRIDEIKMRYTKLKDKVLSTVESLCKPVQL